MKINYSCVRCSRKRSEEKRVNFYFIDDVYDIPDKKFPKGVFNEKEYVMLCEYCVSEIDDVIVKLITNKKEKEYGENQL